MEVPGVEVREQRKTPRAVQPQPQAPAKTPTLNTPPGTREVFNPQTPAPAENKISLPPDTKVVYDPTVENSRARAMSYIQEYVDQSDDPQRASAKINASVHFAKELDMDPALVFEQFDTIVEQIYGRKMDPLSAWESIGVSWKTGNLNTELGKLQYQQMMNVAATGEYDEALQRKIDQIRSQMPPPDAQDRSLPVQALKAVADMAPTMMEGIVAGQQRGLAYGAGAAGVAALAGQAGPQAVLPEELITVPAAFRALYTVGVVSGAAESIGKIEAGLAFEEIASLEDENGEQINPRIAAAASFGVGAINSALEMAQIGSIPGVDRLIASATRKATKRLLIGGGLKEVAKRALTTYGKSVATETAQEIAQESTNIVLAEVAKEINNRVNGTSFTQAQADEVIARLGETAKQSALAFSVMGIPGTVTGSIQDRTAQLKFQEEVRGKLTEADQVRDNIAKALTEEPLAPGKSPDEAVTEYLQNASDEEVDALIESLGKEEASVERQAWEMTAEEFNASQAPKEPRSVTPGRYTPAQEKVVSAVMERSQIGEEQAGLVALFMEMGARGRGMELGEFVDTYYTNEIFSEATIKKTPEGKDAKGYWQIVENAKNLIAIGETADFGTFIHEIGHSFFPYLDDMQTQKVREWTGFQGENWYSPEGKQAQERFADGFIEYLKTGEAVDTETRTVFQQFKSFLQEIYGYLSRTLQLNDGIKQVYSELLGLDTDQAAAREKVQETARRVKAETDQAFNEAAERIQSEIDEVEPLFHVSAYHGSPHTFDRFTTEKIGTGEGAQAFGWGLYFTSEAGIAEWYARKLAGEEGLKYRIAGNKYTQAELPNNLRFQIRMYEKSPTEQRKNIMLDIIEKEIEKGLDSNTVEGLLTLNEIRDAIGESDATPDLAGVEREVPRNLYKVSLFKDKDPSEYTWLEWYEPIPAESAQRINEYLESIPQNSFQETIQEFIGDGTFGVTLADLQQSVREETGESFYQLLSRAVGAPKDASKVLNEAGIDGIRYPAESLSGIPAGARQVEDTAHLNAARAFSEAGYNEDEAFVGLKEAYPDGTTSSLEAAVREAYKNPRWRKSSNYVVFDESAVSIDEHTLFQTAPPPDSPEFKVWFKDSKVVDENGDPLAVYHGTGAGEFDQFSKKQENDYGYRGEGYYFTPDEWEAGFYADTYSGGRKPHIFEVYLSIQNPWITQPGWKTQEPERFTESIKRKGHDGVLVVDEDGDIVEAVAFDSEQIKSVNNRGTWDPNDPRIMYQTSAHEEAVQQAVAEGKPVPDSVLREYADRDWAQAEILRREGEDPVPESMQYLYDEARDHDDKDSFRTYLETFFFDDEELSQLSPEEFSQIVDTIWGAVHEKYLSRSDANDQFLEAMQEKHVIEGALYELAQNGFTGGFGLNKVETSIIMRIGAEKLLSDRQYSYLYEQMQKHPEKYREAMAFYDPMQKEAGQIRYEKMMDELDAAKEQDKEDQRKADRLRLAVMKELGISSPDEIDNKLFTKFMKGKAKYQEIQDAFRQSQREVADLEKQVEKLDREVASDNARIAKMSKAYGEKLKENKRLQNRIETEAAKKFLEHKKRLAERQKALREQRAMKDQMRRLAKLIMKKPGPSIHLEEKRAIRAIQETIDPNFRSVKTLQKRRDALLKEAVGLEVPQEILDIAQKRTLNDFTMEDLERVYSHVMGLTRIGRAKRDAEVAREKTEVSRAAGKIINQILAGDALDLNIPTNAKETRKFTTKKGLIIGALESWKPMRIFEWIDGDKTGEMTEFFYWKVNKLTDQVIRDVNSRRERMQKVLEELGIEARTLGREIEGPKGTYTADQVLSFYVGVKNQKKMKELTRSEGMNALQLQLYAAKLTPQEKALGDAIIRDYQDNYGRLEKAYNEYANEELGSQENYTPVIALEMDAAPLDQQLARHILGKEGAGNRYTEKGFTKERKGGALAIRLGELSIWQDMVGKQEHFITHAHHVRQMNRVLANRNIAVAMKQKLDHEIYKWLQKYVSDVAQYNIHQPATRAEKFWAGWRKRLSVVHLSLNLPVIGRQVWSYPNVLGYADADIWAKGPIEFAAKTAEITRFVEERSPQVKDRSMESVFEEISALNKGKKENVRRRIAEAPMKWISTVDKATCVITWKAAYDTEIRRQQKAIDEGKQTFIDEEKAIRHADTAFLKTQPQARAKDLAWIYRQGEAAKMFLMFSQQLNQLWNIASADVPMYWRQKNWKMLAMQFTGYMMASVAMGVFARKRLPDDIGELGEDFIVQVLNTVPMVGKEIVSLAQGWDVSNPSPFTSMENLWRGFDAMKNMVEEGPNEKDLKKLVRYGGQFAAEVMGLPFTGPRRAVNAVDELINGDWEDSWKHVILGGKPKEE